MSLPLRPLAACPAQLVLLGTQVAAVPLLWDMFQLCRVRHSAFFYEGFLPSEPSVGHIDPSRNIGEMSRPATMAMNASIISMEHVRAQLMMAVKAIHGQDIDANVPLVQAGLDSLSMAPTLEFTSIAVSSCLCRNHTALLTSVLSLMLPNHDQVHGWMNSTLYHGKVCS